MTSGRRIATPTHVSVCLTTRYWLSMLPVVGRYMYDLDTVNSDLN